ncbi:MAG: chromosome segregation protein SMC [Bacillota bacterium]
MYLKRLEIVGFKSFADKVKLEFLPGVTAVVGPNGSGKSNISDALRWVLGEQSIKNLRGARMDDVIFAGSAMRKPLGLAEVSIILDNSDNSLPVDFTEISVTRKLFRSGESEYLINKSAVRLKDVLELFYDTGLGKEAYSVIGQGKIDAILSVKPEERRNILEEAAGIIKYKTRKQVAERKLEETDNNLLRLEDILRELQAQLGPLEAQSVLAEKHLDLKEQLTALEINYYGGLIQDRQSELAGLAGSKAELEDKYQDFEGQQSVIEAEIEQKRLQLLNQENRITELNEDFYRIQNQIDKCSEQIRFLQAKFSDLEKQEAEYQQNKAASISRKEALLQEQAGIEAEIAAIKGKIGGDEAQLLSQEEELAALNQKLAGLEAEEEDLKNETIEILNEVAGLKNKINTNNLQKDFLLKQAVEFQRKLDHLTGQIAGLEADLTAKRGLLDEIDRGILCDRRLQAELAGKMIAQEEELSSVESKNLDWKERIRGIESKLSLLDEMERGYQGYFQGVKALLAEAVDQPFYRSIRGIVADLIKVQMGMELAIEIALGSSLQNVVIDNDQQAQEGIAYLKRHSKGRATFLPLNLIQASENRMLQYQHVLQQYSCQPAISMLQFDPQYRTVLNYLLNQTVVAPDLKTAVKVSSKLDRGFRIVTPEGDLVNPGGSITGGSVDKRRLGLLSRRREIEDLKKEKTDAAAFLEKGLNATKEIKAELNRLSTELENLKKQEQDAKIRKVSVERELQTIEHTLGRAKEEFSALTAQLAELKSESTRFDVGKEELLQLIAVKEKLRQETEEHLNSISEDIRRHKQAKESFIQKITELKSKLSAGFQEENGKVVLKERLMRQTAEIDGLVNDYNQRQEQLKTEKVGIKAQISELEARIAAEQTRLMEQEALISANKKEKDQILAETKELESKERSFRRKNNEFQNQLHKFDLAISQKTLELENIIANLNEDYGIDWERHIDPTWAVPDDAIARIEQLKEDLKALGPVNLAAIDDYQQVKQRFDFLTSQSQDLIKAKESLLKVISEIEGTIVKRFNETFREVRAQFQKIFAELFEGGSADLFLLEPENPLNSGIEIVAQPPGKKLQSLSLLSGGERAMTAIALLFSILAVKPAPFCILDEIDATLDEVNVSRFAKLLELFSKRLQFIVVTHRRGTMEVANTLYGATMEELGVTKLISLDLNQVGQKAG